MVKSVADGAVVEFQSYGGYTQGAQECVDADARQTFDTGAIIQYSCNASDPAIDPSGQRP